MCELCAVEVIYTEGPIRVIMGGRITGNGPSMLEFAIKCDSSKLFACMIARWEQCLPVMVSLKRG
jgi:hypothetical protein